MQKTLGLIPLFQKFIKDAKTGKRRKSDGSKLKAATIDNYTYTIQLLQEFDALKKFPLRIRPVNKIEKRQMIVERNHWKQFTRSLLHFCTSSSPTLTNV